MCVCVYYVQRERDMGYSVMDNKYLAARLLSSHMCVVCMLELANIFILNVMEMSQISRHNITGPRCAQMVVT